MRLALGFGAVVAILVTLLVATKLLDARHQQALVDGMRHADKKSTLAVSMENALFEVGIAMRNIALQSEVEAMQEQEDRVKEERKRYLHAKRQLIALGLTPDEQSIIDKVERLEREIEKPLRQVLTFALAFAPEEAAALLSTTIAPANRAAIAELGRLVAMQEQAKQAFITRSEDAADLLGWILVASGAATLLATGAMAWSITRSITVPLRRAVELSQAVAAGNLSSDVSDGGRDEVGELCASLARMNASLAEIVGRVREGTDSINSEAAEIASGNQELSARTEAQAGSLEETAAAIEELTVTVKQNAEHAEHAHRLVLDASGMASRGGEVMGRVITTMGDIRNHSAKIAGISAMIDSIAFQTNILSLNAAVEAARAGSSGRGFAVVAAEVRILAQRSADAAKEIAKLIAASGEGVAQGARLADEAGGSMRDIIASIHQVAQIMAGISTASMEQSRGIIEISQAVTQIDEITQQNAAMVEEAAAASQSLEQQCAALLTAVSVFRLAARHPANGPRPPAAEAQASAPQRPRLA